MNFPLDINYEDVNLWISIVTIIFNPLFWNVVARSEYRTHKFSQVVGSAKLACTLLAMSIFLLGLFRDWRFKLMLESQPHSVLLHDNWIHGVGYLSVTFGLTLTYSSFWSLGFFGTFLGDYFGILQKKMVTGFPFNIVDNPMYIGSTLNFLGIALLKASPCGMLVTVFVGIVYRIALLYEEPFTAYIYSKAEKQKAKIH